MREIIHPWFRGNGWIFLLTLVLGLVLTYFGDVFSYVGFTVILLSLVGWYYSGDQEDKKLIQ